ncbi:MAG: alpha/beta hydrolase [Candidatus Odinarchaeota archaeon]
MVSKGMENVIKLLKQFHDSTDELSVKIIREGFNFFATISKLPKDVIAEPVNAGGVPAEWITTPDVIPDHVLLYFHGGGYIAGSIDTHRDLVARISRAAKVRVLIIDYRLAPEHPFPAALEDAVSTYQWLISIEKINPKNLIIGGDSAGGGLTVSTLVKLREKGITLPTAGVYISPWIDLAGTGESMKTKAELDPFITPELNDFCAKTYLKDVDPKNYLASPLYADLKGVPPMYIQVGNSECILDDSKRLAKNAKEAGIDVELDIWEDMIHIFPIFAPLAPEGQQAIQKVGNFIQKNLKKV